MTRLRIASAPGVASSERAAPASAFLVALLALGFLLAPGATAPTRAAVALKSTDPTWTNVSASSPTAPPTEYWASLTLDYTDRELVLFGGCGITGCPEPAQTWAFGHGLWTNISSASVQPPSRSYASLGFDSASGSVILFGGVGGSRIFGDTWTFSGGRWANRTGSLATAPSSRWAASTAYDPIDRGLLLFGGMSPSGALLNDTWIFTQGSWRNLTSASSPPARYEASMAWDVAASEAVLVDGCGLRACPLGDAWRFQGGLWSLLPSDVSGAPPPRFLAALSYDAASGRLVLFGGIRNGTSLGDAWSYSPGSWTASNATGLPTAREGSAVLESTEVWTSQGTPAVWPYLVLWGGDHVLCPTCPLLGLADTWVLEPSLHATVTTSGGAAPPGTQLTFVAAVSGGAAPFRYAWTYGDGTTDASGPNASHAFPAAGSYLVTAVVQDDAGARTQATIPITVTASWPTFYTAAGIGVAGILLFVGGWWTLRKRRPPST